MPQSRVVLCTVYGLIALAALIATWSQNLAYFKSPAELIQSLGAFLIDLKVNSAARSVTADIALVLLAAAIFMVIEARKHRIRFVWAYILGGIFIAISVTLPLFLIARELRLAAPEANRLSNLDVVLLAALTTFVAALTVWIDVM
jgi:uncharacterized membrane protein (UPF0182 family)